MIYLLYGTEDILITDEINKVVLENNIDEFNISRYNLEESLLKNIIEDCQTMTLFNDKKMVIVDNSYIFVRTQKKYLEQDIDVLIEYSNNPNPNTILIFRIESEKLDTVKKIYKQIKENINIKEFNKPKNVFNYVKNLFTDYKIDEDSINLFVKRVGNDLNILKKESEKIKIYKLDDMAISKKDILDISVNTIDLNIFNFIDNIINKNKEKALIIYKEMLNLNEEPIKIIIMLANKFRLMYQACELSKRGYSPQAVADKLNQKKYPVELAINNGFKYDSKIILDILNNLADLDCNIKMGLVDKETALELFILKL